MRYCSIDIETSGLIPKTHQILEVVVIVDNTDAPTVPSDQLPTYHRVIVWEEILWQSVAMRMNRRYVEAMMNNNLSSIGETIELQDLASDLKRWLWSVGINPRDITAAGKNFGTFDLQHLKLIPWFSEHLKIHSRVIDPAVFFIEKTDKKLPDTALCAVRANLDDQKIDHDPITDARRVVELFRFGFSRLGIV